MFDSTCPSFDSNLSMNSRQSYPKFSECPYFQSVTSVICVVASIAAYHTTLYWNQPPIPFIKMWRLSRDADWYHYCLSFGQSTTGISQRLLWVHFPAWLELTNHLALCPWWCWYWHWSWVGFRMIIDDLYCFEAQKMCHSYCTFYCRNIK